MRKGNADALSERDLSRAGGLSFQFLAMSQPSTLPDLEQAVNIC